VADDQSASGEAFEGLADRAPADAELHDELWFSGEAAAVEALSDAVGEELLELMVERHW
jgi:hypothetical protein